MQMSFLKVANNDEHSILKCCLVLSSPFYEKSSYGAFTLGKTSEKNRRITIENYYDRQNQMEYVPIKRQEGENSYVCMY